ncbi:MAG: 6-hydroxymethylpterin diphosphokinase MptE-like protein [Candidatus Hadarchaeales archaeon]
MDWETWKPWYDKIVLQLGINRKADEEAARVLNSLLPEPDLDGIRNLLSGRECVVFGAGPSLEKNLEKISKTRLFRKTIISADGATTAVMRHRTPEIIVTDLDGKVDDQINAWKHGAWLVIHAHGDNIKRVSEIVPKLGERVIGTTQVRPFGKLFNFGGFTDGDRAVFMARWLGASRIYLAGMDLGVKIGRYSGNKDPRRKSIKLRICEELLEWLKELGTNIVDLTRAQSKPTADISAGVRCLVKK